MSLINYTTNAMLCNGMQIMPDSSIIKSENALGITYNATSDSSKMIICYKHNASNAITCFISSSHKKGKYMKQELLDEDSAVNMFKRLSALYQQQILDAQQKDQELTQK